MFYWESKTNDLSVSLLNYPHINDIVDWQSNANCVSVSLSYCPHINDMVQWQSNTNTVFVSLNCPDIKITEDRASETNYLSVQLLNRLDLNVMVD